MILAKHALDAGLHEHIDREHGGCVACWRDTALAAVESAASMLPRCWPLPELDGNGVATGQSIDWLYDIVDGFLEAEAADRRDLERGP
jgi:hypothetical protein